MYKRSFDFILSLFLLFIFFFPGFLVFLFLILINQQAPFFIQNRVGRNGQIFRIVKFRSMRYNRTKNKNEVTRLGAYLRKYKVDEWPQLYNILMGEMSFVGPRPDEIGFADELKGADRLILTVRPGLTGPAQLAFYNEEYLLQKQTNPTTYNKEIIWPQKVEINKAYVLQQSFYTDLKYLIHTILRFLPFK